MCKKISNRLSEIAPAGRRTLRREFRVPILYLLHPSVVNGHVTVYWGLVIYDVKGFVCFILKFALPPLSPPFPSVVQFLKQSRHGTFVIINIKTAECVVKCSRIW